MSDGGVALLLTDHGYLVIVAFGLLLEAEVAGLAHVQGCAGRGAVLPFD